MFAKLPNRIAQAAMAVGVVGSVAQVRALLFPRIHLSVSVSQSSSHTFSFFSLCLSLFLSLCPPLSVPQACTYTVKPGYRAIIFDQVRGLQDDIKGGYHSILLYFLVFLLRRTNVLSKLTSPFLLFIFHR
jgi:hypothetical protein